MNVHQLVPISKAQAYQEILLLPKQHPKPRLLHRYVHNSLLQEHVLYESFFHLNQELLQEQFEADIQPENVSNP